MADELVGRVEEPGTDPGMKGELAHENEQGDDREAVGPENVKNVAGEKIQGRVEGNKGPEPDETHGGHDEPDGHPGENEHEEETDSDDADGLGVMFSESSGRLPPGRTG